MEINLGYALLSFSTRIKCFNDTVHIMIEKAVSFLPS